MENLPRDVEKNVATFTPPKPSKRSGSGTFLFVGRYGKTREIPWLKGLLLTMMVILVAAMGMAGYFYFLYQNAIKENQRFQAALHTSEQKPMVPGIEKKMLASSDHPAADKPDVGVISDNAQKSYPKVVADRHSDIPLAENFSDKKMPEPDNVGPERKEAALGKSNLGSEKKTVKPEPDEVKPEKKEADKSERDDVSHETGDMKANTDHAKNEEALSDKEQVDDQTPPAQIEKPVRVGAEKLDVSYIKRSKTLKVNFVVRNIDPNSGRLSGHGIVILKPKQGGQKRWLTLPRVKLVSGEPTGKQIGEKFSISKFKTLKFEAKRQWSPKRFKTATVFIFEEQGELLLKKDFPVEID